MSAQRTFSTVRRQAFGYGVNLFELGIRTLDGRMLPRRWDYRQLIRALIWLRLQNLRGADIFIRPAQPLGLILLDDLNRDPLYAMRRDGFPPAVVVETSPHNFQAWVRLIANRHGQFLATPLLTAAAVALAMRYQADPNSADWRHFGRLAGFTNRKPCHRRNGRFPFVFLRHASGAVAPAGRDLLLRLKRQISPSPKETPASNLSLHLGSSYPQRFHRILATCSRFPWASKPDPSRIDFMIASDMAAQGYEPARIRQVLAQSPGLSASKAGHLEDYLNRTILAASQPFSPHSRASAPAVNSEQHVTSESQSFD